ncbi:type VI secretion system lipoprotein TssJ [Polaromonas sp. YR568]|uniref:type VI secretion system lipoprotein TssJ n=1 Tax=Polaromonas sp. YR568 TaxID=1855301 RepID=UPI00158700E9|nr:type VI secretion system lipoprotein TssJ [Polaromonas sp. YR568]
MISPKLPLITSRQNLVEKRSLEVRPRWKAGAWLAAAGLGMVLAGCSTANSLMGGNTRKEAVAEIAWDFARNAILVEVEADPKLNQYGGEAHTLVLGVYQMEDSAAFYKLIADAALVGKSLESGKGGEGFVHFARYVVTPGQHSILQLDRAQKAKFVGIAAGYYQIEAAKSARLFEVPLTVESSGMVSTTYKAAPATLAVRLNLGPDELVNAQRLNRDPTEKKSSEAVPLDGGGREIKLTPDTLNDVMNVNSAVKKLDK